MLKQRLSWLAITIAGLVLMTLTTSIPAQNNPPTRAITQIAGDLYRFQNNFHFSVFLVTPDGVIASDPIDADAAQWLSDEIKTRFDKPIKYVFYSHHHADHVSGGEVFADAGAEVIAHENTPAQLKEKNVPTAMPDITFSDRHTIELGGKKVELIWPGRSHSDDLIVAYFPDERTIFTVDFISVKRLPYRTLGGSFFPDWFDTIDKVAAMDFDILAPGHGDLGTKQDAVDHNQYLRELYAAVKQGKAEGKSVDELKGAITMENYKNWGQYDQWLQENIEGIYGYVSD
jgi:glyoxylase-like metal-dependent hydrolase (beta-lactamase superfamily II)